MSRKDSLIQVIFLSLLILCTGLLVPAQVIAGDFPTKPIQLIIPWTPGGITDILGRIVSDKSIEYLGQKMVVVNKPGAGGTLGINFVVKAVPDAYIIGLTGSTLTIHSALGTDLPYDPMKDITFICRITFSPNLILVRADSPLNTLEKLIDYARGNPGKLNYGTSGIGSSLHLGGELLQSVAGIEMVHVPYKGAAPAMIALLGGHIDLMFSNTADSLEQIKAGKLLPLAVTTAERFGVLSHVPSIAEKGYPGAALVVYLGVFGPAGLPKPIADKLAGYFQKVVALPDVQGKLKELCMIPAYAGPDEFDRFIRSDFEKMQDLVKKANIKLK